MTTQLQLKLAKAGPEISAHEVDLLTSYLCGRGWVRASRLEIDLHLDERRVRAIAEASDGLIISGPGCPGYKLLAGTAELADVDHAACRLESQAKRMLHRARALRMRAHQLVG